MAIIHVKEEEFASLLEGELVVVDFFANWCGPCKMLTPILEKIEKENENLKILKVNVDECPNLARSYGVMSIPTLILFKQGNQLSTKVGFMPELELKDWIEKGKGI